MPWSIYSKCFKIWFTWSKLFLAWGIKSPASMLYAMRCVSFWCTRTRCAWKSWCLWLHTLPSVSCHVRHRHMLRVKPTALNFSFSYVCSFVRVWNMFRGHSRCWFRQESSKKSTCLPPTCPLRRCLLWTDSLTLRQLYYNIEIITRFSHYSICLFCVRYVVL